MPSDDNDNCGGSGAPIALQFEPALDARGEIILHKNLVDAPELPLQFYRGSPISATTALVQNNALLWHDARGSSHPALSDQHYACGNAAVCGIDYNFDNAPALGPAEIREFTGRSQGSQSVHTGSNKIIAQAI
jgi:hypothetical protein